MKRLWIELPLMDVSAVNIFISREPRVLETEGHVINKRVFLNRVLALLRSTSAELQILFT